MAKLIIDSQSPDNHILRRYGYKLIGPNHYQHSEGHEVKINPSLPSYPYSIKHKDYDTWDDQFSEEGLLSQLHDFHDKDK